MAVNKNKKVDQETLLRNFNFLSKQLSGGYVPYIGATGNINIGDYFLTGRFIARPGHAGLGLAPLIFQAGDLLTIPEAGTVEFDGTGMYITPTNHRRFISLASDSSIATTTATTVAPTTLWTGVTNANELKVYRVYVIKGCGLANNVSAAGIATIAIDLGGTVVNTLTTPAVKLTNEPFHFEVFFTIRAVGVIATGRVSSFGTMEIGTSDQHTVNESAAIDTTVLNNVSLIVTWSGAHASNWIKLTQTWLAEAD